MLSLSLEYETLNKKNIERDMHKEIESTISNDGLRRRFSLDATFSQNRQIFFLIIEYSVYAYILRSLVQGMLLVIRLRPVVHGTLHHASLLRTASANPTDLRQRDPEQPVGWAGRGNSR